MLLIPKTKGMGTRAHTDSSQKCCQGQQNTFHGDCWESFKKEGNCAFKVSLKNILHRTALEVTMK